MYGKLFASLYQGTLRGCSDEILVFTNLIAHADATGIVDKHYRSIAEETGIDQDRVKKAIENLEAPDAESRSPEQDGRRIIPMDEHRSWGWQIVNYDKYRSIRNEEDRREKNRIAQEKWRNKQKAIKETEASQQLEGSNITVDNSKQGVSTRKQNKPKQKKKKKKEEEEELREEDAPNFLVPPPKKGSRIPDVFLLTKEMREYAALKRPDVDPVLETEKFCNHFRALTGRNATKLRWDLTWQNWILNSKGATTNGTDKQNYQDARAKRAVEKHNLIEQLRAKSDARREEENLSGRGDADSSRQLRGQ